MAVQAGFATYCSELLSTAGEVRSKRMFGACGLYIDDVFVRGGLAGPDRAETATRQKEFVAPFKCEPFAFGI